MTKTTKIIAALGVVAGLGVAALPMSTYAATVSGSVNVQAEVQDSIAMRIHSNADGYNYAAVADPSGDPQAQGWYVEDGGVYTLTTDTTVQDGTTYYTRSDAYAVFKINPAGTGEAGETDTDTAISQATGLQLAGNSFDSDTLYSNIAVRSNTGSFSLTVIDADATNDLDLDTPSDTVNEFIPSVTGNNQALVRTTAGWGFHVGDIADASAAIWNEVPVTGNAAYTIASTGSNTPGSFSSDYTVHYGVASGATKTGTYSDTITYTATAL